MLLKPLSKLSIKGVQICKFNTSATCCLIQKWRKEKGLPLNPNSYGILTDKPDFTYLDGRPTPVGCGQKRRIEEQEVLAQKIIDLSAEIDFAVARHNKMKLDEKKTKENIIKNKLKAKGEKLLAKGDSKDK